MFHELLQHKVSLHVVPHDVRQGTRIGSITQEASLVYVDADANRRAPDLRSLQVVLDKYASHLAVLIVDIVGPLNAEAWRKRIEGVSNGKGCHLRNSEHPSDRQVARHQAKAEKEILGSLRFPSVRVGTPSSALELSRHERRPAVARRAEMAQEVVCGVHLIEPYHTKTRRIFQAEMRLHCSFVTKG